MNADEPKHDTERTSTPPARLAARLQRRSQSRRRTSAQSSRRSSISSLHSRTSSLSCHGGPYSTHIAQHLRRASIIESRKARLAERAAHAEQVRLRAAAAKAAPRASNSEEKALAAHAAREKLLAEIAARCEEEVKRAKRIAEETREKKAAEHARLEAQMAEKFADAARRRSNYQMNFRRPRTTSLAAVEEKKIERAQLKTLTVNAAAKVIQRFWRQSYARRAASAFRKCGVGLDSFRSMSFEEVTKLIASEDTMTTTMRFVKHLGMLDGETDENAQRGSVRVFLSAFMVVAHPLEAFSKCGQDPQEKDLIAKGEVLVDAIQAITDALVCDQNSPSSRDQLQFLFQDFTSRFHAWKSQDLGLLANMLIRSFVNLDLIVQSTKDDRDGHVADDYLQAARTEQTKILVRLKRLIGSEKALDCIRKAVRKARKEMAVLQTRETVEHVPRASTPTDMEIDLTRDAFMTPPATPVRKLSREERVDEFVKKLGLMMTVLPSNREISHCIQIDGKYQIEQQPWTNSKKKMMDALRYSMREALQTGGADAESAWTQSMVMFVKKKISALVTPQHPLAMKIYNFLDPKLIAQQIEKGVFNFKDFFDTIANIVKQMCSPGRDEIVKDFSEDASSDVIDRLFSLINILDLMTLDHINFQFRIAAIHVQEHGAAHETEAFQKDIKDGVHGLERTRDWWVAGRSAIVTSHAPSTAAYANTVYARALVDLVFSNTPFLHEKVPETLQLDFIRLLGLRRRAFHMICVASILLTSKIRLRRNREDLWNREAERLMKLDLRSTDVAAIVGQIESGHMMPDSTRSGLIDFVSRVLPSAVAAARQMWAAEEERENTIREERAFNPDLCRTPDDENAVFREQVATFLLKSLREHLFARLAAYTTTEKVRAASSAGEILARVGMPEFVEEVSTLVNSLEKIKFVDCKAHEPWYNEIANTSTELDV